MLKIESQKSATANKYKWHFRKYVRLELGSLSKFSKRHCKLSLEVGNEMILNSSSYFIIFNLRNYIGTIILPFL